MILKAVKSLIFIVISFTFQYTNCDDNFSKRKIKEFTLRNGINVILHEDFRMPVVLVGVIFHVGSINAPFDKIGVTELVAANIINKKIHNVFMSSGISYKVSTSSEDTEILAEMNPKKIKEFFSQICLLFSGIDIEDLNIYKKQLVIESKLNKYFSNSALIDNIFSNIDSRNIFNEFTLASITEDEVISFYEDNFQTCKVSIIVVGSIDYKNLIKTLRASISNSSDRRKQEINSGKNNKIFKDVLLESKYSGNSSRYIYSVSSCENKKIEEVFLNILRYEAFRFFGRNHSLISHYNVENIFHRENSVWLFSLFPKKDVSINELQKVYNTFVNKITMISLEYEYLSKVSGLKKMETQISFSDLFYIYHNIKNAYMRGMELDSIYAISDDIKRVDIEAIRSFAENFFYRDLISIITTRFRSDK